MSRVKILIVEDEQLVADDLRETLVLLGYDVLGVVASGAAAIAQAATLQPQLVLMDIRLQGEMDGIAASATIRDRYHIPVVYLTANADRTTLERAKATQPFGYILKPFDDGTLTTTIEIALARHQAEASVQQALDHATQRQHTAETAARQKSQVLAQMSHELRNPLTTIQFALSALQQSGDAFTATIQQRHLKRIQDALHSLSYLLENILLLEKGSAGRMPLKPRPIDLLRFCQDQLEALQFKAQSASGQTVGLSLVGEPSRGDLSDSALSNAELAAEWAQTLQFVTALSTCRAVLDETLLWHLLNNLLANAIKYSPQGGSIILQLQTEGNELVLQVRDHGIGIPAVDLPQIFEPFQRAGNVAEIAGTGLGLAIAHQCAELMGGRLTVESQLGQGSTFTARLPWRRD
jgi:signal transduction histidine kinase